MASTLFFYHNAQQALDIIHQLEIDNAILRDNYLQRLNDIRELEGFREKYLEIVQNFQLLKDSLTLNQETIEFIEENLEHTLENVF